MHVVIRDDLVSRLTEELRRAKHSAKFLGSQLANEKEANEHLAIILAHQQRIVVLLKHMLKQARGMRVTGG